MKCFHSMSTGGSCLVSPYQTSSLLRTGSSLPPSPAGSMPPSGIAQLKGTGEGRAARRAVGSPLPQDVPSGIQEWGELPKGRCRPRKSTEQKSKGPLPGPAADSELRAGWGHSFSVLSLLSVQPRCPNYSSQSRKPGHLSCPLKSLEGSFLAAQPPLAGRGSAGRRNHQGPPSLHNDISHNNFKGISQQTPRHPPTPHIRARGLMHFGPP